MELGLPEPCRRLNRVTIQLWQNTPEQRRRRNRQCKRRRHRRHRHHHRRRGNCRNRQRHQNHRRRRSRKRVRRKPIRRRISLLREMRFPMMRRRCSSSTRPKICPIVRSQTTGRIFRRRNGHEGSNLRRDLDQSLHRRGEGGAGTRDALISMADVALSAPLHKPSSTARAGKAAAES